MAKVEINLTGIKKLNAEIKRASKQTVKVGVLAGATYPTGTKVDKVAEFLEYGWEQTVTLKQRVWFTVQGLPLKKGTILRCPPRPFFRATLTAKEQSWKEKGMQALKGVEHNPVSKITKALMLLGLVAQQDLQDTIMNGAVEGEKFAQRAELTLLLYSGQAKAGKHKLDSTPNQTTTRKPLYRTGLLASSIVFDIEK